MMRPTHRGTDPASLRRHVVKGSGEWATVPTCVRDAIADLLASAAQPPQPNQRASAHRRASSASRRRGGGSVAGLSHVAESSNYSDASLSGQPHRHHAESRRQVREVRGSPLLGPRDAILAEVSVTRPSSSSSYHPGSIVLPLSPLDDESLLLSVRTFDDAERLRLHAVRNTAAFHNNIEQLSRDCRLCLSPEVRAAIQLHPLVVEDLKQQQHQPHHQQRSMSTPTHGGAHGMGSGGDVVPNLSRHAAERMRHEESLWNDVLDAVHALRKASVRFTANFFSDDEKRALGIDPLLLPRDPLRAETAPSAGSSRPWTDSSPLYANAASATPNTATRDDTDGAGREVGGTAARRTTRTVMMTAPDDDGQANVTSVTGLSSGPFRVPASSRRLFLDAREDSNSVFISTAALQSRGGVAVAAPRRSDDTGEFERPQHRVAYTAPSSREEGLDEDDAAYRQPPRSHEVSAEINGAAVTAEDDEAMEDRSPRRARGDAMATDIRVSDEDDDEEAEEAYHRDGLVVVDRGGDSGEPLGQREVWEDSFDPITRAIVAAPFSTAAEAPTTDTDNEPRVRPYQGTSRTRGGNKGRRVAADRNGGGGGGGGGGTQVAAVNPLADRNPPRGEETNNDESSHWLAPPPPLTTVPSGNRSKMAVSHPDPRAARGAPTGLPPTSPVGHLAWSAQQQQRDTAPNSSLSPPPLQAQQQPTTPNRSAMLLNEIRHLPLGNSPLASPQVAARMSPEQILQALDELGPIPLAPPSTVRTRDDTVIHPPPRAIAVKKRTALVPKGSSPDRSGSVSPSMSSVVPSPANSQRSERGGGHFVLRGGTSPGASSLTLMSRPVENGGIEGTYLGGFPAGGGDATRRTMTPVA